MAWLNWATEPEWDRGAPLARQVRAGLQLYLHCLWQMGRMRRVWVVLAVLAVFQTWTAVARTPRNFHGQATPLQVLGLYRQVQRQSSGLLTSLVILRWRDPHRIVTNLTWGTSRPLSGRLSSVLQPVIERLGRRLGEPIEHDALPTPPSLLLSMVLANLLYAALTAGVLGWVLAAIRGKPLSGRAFTEAIGRGLPLTLAWFLLLDMARLLLSVGFRHADPRVVTSVDSAYALLTFPFFLLPAAAVTLGSSLAGVRATLRVFASRGAMIIGFLLPFRVIYDLIGLGSWPLDALTLGFLGYGTVAQAVVTGVVIIGQLILSGLALLVCVAAMLIVVRSRPRTVEVEAATS